MKPFLLYLGSFVLLTLLVSLGLVNFFDELFLFSWPGFLSLALKLFSPLASLCWLGILALLLWQRVAKIEVIVLLGALFLVTLVLEIVLKTVIPTESVALFPLFPFMEGAYPSGHLLRGTFFVGILVLLGYSRFFWLLVVLQGVSMLSVLGHTASDLFGGYLLGMVAVSLFSIYLDRQGEGFGDSPSPKQEVQREGDPKALFRQEYY